MRQIKETVLLRQYDEEHWLTYLTAAQVDGMEIALATLLCEQTGHLVSCGRLLWFQVGGAEIRPSMTIRLHQGDLARLLWATRFGSLYDIVVHQTVAQETIQLMYQWATTPATCRVLTDETVTAAENWSPTPQIVAALS